MRIAIAIATGIGLFAGDGFYSISLADRLQPEQNARCKLSYFWFKANRNTNATADAVAVIPTEKGNIGGQIDVPPNAVRPFLTGDQQDEADSISYWGDPKGSKAETLLEHLSVDIFDPNDDTRKIQVSSPFYTDVKYGGDADNGIDFVLDDVIDTGSVMIFESKPISSTYYSKLEPRTVGLQLSTPWIRNAVDKSIAQSSSNEGARVVATALNGDSVLVPVLSGVRPWARGWGWAGYGWISGYLIYFPVNADNPRP